MNRFKSPVVWASVLAQLCLIAAMLFGENIADDIKICGGAVIELFTLFGVLNNPTDKENF